jgi:hypothetical protein
MYIVKLDTREIALSVCLSRKSMRTEKSELMVFAFCAIDKEPQSKRRIKY